MLIQTFNTIQSYNQFINPANQIGAPVYGQGYSFQNPLAKLPGQMTDHPNYMYWCSPMVDFNPWTNTQPDDPFFPGKSMEEINLHLQEGFQVCLYFFVHYSFFYLF